tara:strand:- start:3086 stop:3265 length:180 start_codon:yes stop_codon:yes gene_type:complete
MAVGYFAKFVQVLYKQETTGWQFSVRIDVSSARTPAFRFPLLIKKTGWRRGKKLKIPRS